MLRAWRAAFAEIDARGSLSDHGNEADLAELWEHVTFATPVIELHLGTRASNALDRANVTDVAGLLRTSPATLWRLRGVGKRTCREILDCQRALRARLGTPTELADLVEPPSADPHLESADIASLGIDLLVNRVISPAAGALEQSALRALLALDPDDPDLWPSQSDVARRKAMTPVTVHNLLKSAIARWQRDPAITRFRNDLVELISGEGGVCVVDELPVAALAIRGSGQEEPIRSRQAMAVVRAAG